MPHMQYNDEMIIKCLVSKILLTFCKQAHTHSPTHTHEKFGVPTNSHKNPKITRKRWICSQANAKE